MSAAAGQVAQHQRACGCGEHVEQGKAHLDGLDAGAFPVGWRSPVAVL
jgi:hypothetical protein